MASEGRCRRQFRRSGAPRGLRTLISSSISRIWSSARAAKLKFNENSDDLELRVASEGRFRRQFRGSGVARGLRTSISSTVWRIWSSARPRNLDFVDSFEDLEAPRTGKTRAPQIRPTRKSINLPRDGLVLLYLSIY